MPATILITGANGLIGFRLVLAALSDGHNVRFTVRSEEKGMKVSENPAVKKLAPGDRLSAVIIADLTAPGAFDDAMQGVTHVLHAGSPVPVPGYDATTQIFEPTVKMASNILSSALQAPSVKRVIITSSIVCNVGLTPPEHAVPATARVPLPSPVPTTFEGIYEGYTMGKVVELHNSDQFVATQKPHFTVSHVVPGYIFGRNELALDAHMMQTANSSNMFLMMGMLGGTLPFPIHSGIVHLDDVADIHMRVAFLEPAEGDVRDYGIAVKVDYATIFDIVEKHFPKAVAAGIFKRGTVSNLPVNYDSTDAEKLLGGLRTFESAVVDVASQYLEKIGAEKA
ncbi:putative cinnamoyl-CoA reductase [Xylariaceae sp. FL0016]|nr:putative cinnamoyl-CoA reductase [Xylariaceae sp. FL0016]